MADILNPINGIRDAQRAVGITPKNFMAANRNLIRQKSATYRSREEAKMVEHESKMQKAAPKKYQDVKSRVGQPPRPQTAALGGKPPVPKDYARMPLAPLSQRKDNYAFGGSYKRPSSTTNAKSTPASLTTQALAKFDENTAKVVTYGREEDQIIAQKPMDPEIIANPGENWKEDQSEMLVTNENKQTNNMQKHSNYGKTPKYI